MTDLPDLSPKQQALLEQYSKAHAAWVLAVNLEEDVELGTAWASALVACKDAGFDPFHYPVV
jgi:hypothetical protein